MNTSAEVTLEWGDGRYLFALKARQIEHLEKACNSGIQEIAQRLMTGAARYADIRMAVHLGLEGGGMPPVKVAEAMERWFDGQPLANPKDPSSPLATAQAVVLAAFFGLEDIETSGEAQTGESPVKPT